MGAARALSLVIRERGAAAIDVYAVAADYLCRASDAAGGDAPGAG